MLMAMCHLQEGEPAAGGKCTRTGSRRAPAALVPNGTDVVAVRVSAPGWENAILDGLQVLLCAAFSLLRYKSTLSMYLFGILIFVFQAKLPIGSGSARSMTTLVALGSWVDSDSIIAVVSLQALMEVAPPSVVVMDLHASRMRRGGGGTALALLRRMTALGFSDISHSGPVCDSRWLKMTKGLRCDIAAMLQQS